MVRREGHAKAADIVRAAVEQCSSCRPVVQMAGRKPCHSSWTTGNDGTQAIGAGVVMDGTGNLVWHGDIQGGNLGAFSALPLVVEQYLAGYRPSRAWRLDGNDAICTASMDSPTGPA